MNALRGQSFGTGAPLSFGAQVQPQPQPGAWQGPAPVAQPLPTQPVASVPQATPAFVPQPAPARSSSGPLPESLYRTESGGNLRALNSEGYGGRGQFGAARLRDAYNAGVIPRPLTGAEYAQMPEDVQARVEAWHRNDILSQLGGYVGQDIDGPGGIPPLTESSILAVAHLGGTNGARRFIESGGRYDPADSNGTNLSDYARTHAGGSMPSGGGYSGGSGGASGAPQAPSSGPMAFASLAQQFAAQQAAQAPAGAMQAAPEQPASVGVTPPRITQSNALRQFADAVRSRRA